MSEAQAYSEDERIYILNHMLENGLMTLIQKHGRNIGSHIDDDEELCYSLPIRDLYFVEMEPVVRAKLMVASAELSPYLDELDVAAYFYAETVTLMVGGMDIYIENGRRMT